MKASNDYLLAFVKQMDFELKANEHKGDWRNFVDKSEIRRELEYHLNKLSKAENDYAKAIDPEKRQTNKLLIKEYIADSANILMMLGKAYKLYEKD